MDLVYHRLLTCVQLQHIHGVGHAVITWMDTDINIVQVAATCMFVTLDYKDMLFIFDNSQHTLAMMYRLLTAQYKRLSLDHVM